jgi:hypothetical protein
VRRNGSGIRQLLLYREATPGEQARLSSPSETMERGEIEIMAVVEGYVADVRCSQCGEVRTWVPGQEALQRLLANYGIEAVDGQEVER